jgi:hypothetical protein
MAPSGLVCAVSLRNTRGGALSFSPETTPLQSCVSTVPLSLDHQLLVPPIDGEQMHDIAEAIPELQARTGAGRAHLPIEHPLAREGEGRQPQALDGVADGLRISVVCDVANRDQHRCGQSAKW